MENVIRLVLQPCEIHDRPMVHEYAMNTIESPAWFMNTFMNNTLGYTALCMPVHRVQANVGVGEGVSGNVCMCVGGCVCEGA